MNELSLFSGAGGGLLGTHLLGWKAIGYVEWDEYCQRVIAARIKDGNLPVAPIFTDVRQFIQSGAAAEYRGIADVVTAGFPCQPFSVAGKQLGADDPRNMWPATIATIRTVRPRYAFLENVPGLLTSGYFGTILGDLAESGYDCRWRILSAAEVGAPHKRDRLWIIADACSTEWWTQTQFRQYHLQGENDVQKKRQQSSNGLANLCSSLAHANGTRLEKRQGENTGTTQSNIWPVTGRGEWWAIEPDVGRVANGMASRVDRLRAIGNGQVSAVVRTAWEYLTQYP